MHDVSEEPFYLACLNQGYFFGNNVSPVTGTLGYTGFCCTENFVCEVSVLDSAFDDERFSLYVAAVIVMIIALVLATAIMIIVMLAIVKPLRSANETINALVKDIHNGRGDLTTRIPIKTGDEVGQLSDNMNQFIATLQNIMNMLGESSDKLSGISSSVRDNIASTEDEITNVSATMQEMSASSEETAASLTHVTQQVDTIASLVNSVLDQSNQEGRDGFDSVTST